MPTPTDKPKRRWLPRWSMRAMFLGVTVVCVWFGLLSRRAQEQRRAVEALREIDGVTIRYDYEVQAADNWGFIVISDAEISPPGPAWLRDLIGVDYFAEVTVVECRLASIYDDDLRHLQHFSQLKSLTLENCAGTFDVGLKHLVNLTSLTELVLFNNGYTTLPPEIGNLTKLKNFDVGHNQITTFPSEIVKLRNLASLNLDGNDFATLPDEIWQLTKLKWLGLASHQFTKLPPKIGNLRNLTFLRLSCNAIDDANVEQLKLLKKLEDIWLRGTNVTKEGVADLRRALPDCEIKSNF